MRSGRDLLALSLCLLWVSVSDSVIQLPEYCYRFAPAYSGGILRSSGSKDEGFEIDVRRFPDGAKVGNWFEPEREYLVVLRNVLPMVTFDDFLFWLTSTEPPMKMPMFEGENTTDCSKFPTLCVGTWVHTVSQRGSSLGLPSRRVSRGSRRAGLVLTHNRPGCRGLVVERFPGVGGSGGSGAFSRISRQMGQIALLWRSPSAKQHNCVTLHAMVRTQTSVLKEVGGLMKTLCPTEMRPMEPVISGFRQSAILNENNDTRVDPMRKRPRDSVQPKDCCACGTATYRLTFQGMWNKTTHPQDWPSKYPNLLHWTNLIGASHSPSFQIYAMGQTASAGVQSVCAYGDTTVLREALSLAAAKAEGAAGVPTGSQSATTDVSPLRALISTPGMWGEETLMEQRSTVFSVNRTHPLFSMLTMLGPSPDWCTGISGQSLCKADCTWVKNMTLSLRPWDAGIREGDTYMPKESDRKEIPDPIRYIDESWMPGNPFRDGKPIARVHIERILPKHDWQCTNKDADGVQLFLMGGGIRVVGKKMSEDGAKGKNMKDEGPVSSSVQQIVTGKGRGKSSKSVGFGGPGSSGTLGTNNPLSDPSLAQMATFLCITSEWSAWSACSVSCGVGTKTRTRELIANKKPELCQHVPLLMEESCEGRKRTCDYSAPCSFLPWTLWSPCNATCESPVGYRTRTRALARPEEEPQCRHLWADKPGGMQSMMFEIEQCRVPQETCEPATICGEGPKQGYPCGNKLRKFYYSAIDHECLEFEYLGCKGGRNMFDSKEQCEKFCIPTVEALPAWRRERMALLQFKTSQLAASSGESVEEVKQDPACHYEVNTGYECEPPKEIGSYWYYCTRTNRCRDFFYLGCGGTPNRWANHTACMAACMPNELRQSQLLAKVRSTTGSRKSGASETAKQTDEGIPEGLEAAVSPKQDCRVTAWGGWGPCSARCSSQRGQQLRLRAITRPARYGGAACGPLYEKRECYGDDASC